VLERGREGGTYEDFIAKAIIVLIYAEWEEVSRPAIAAELGAKPDEVKCVLMGDLRRIRNCIIHNRSSLTEEAVRVKELGWDFSVSRLTVTKEMLAVLIDQINSMYVRIEH